MNAEKHIKMYLGYMQIKFLEKSVFKKSLVDYTRQHSHPMTEFFSVKGTTVVPFTEKSQFCYLLRCSA